MLYFFMTTPDGTTVSHSEVLSQSGKEQVRVYAKKWNKKRKAFDSIEIFLPDCEEINIVGFSSEEAQKHIEHFRNLKDVIWECAVEKSGVEMS